MTTNTLLLLVEGPHDLEFCARLLKPMGFHRIQQYEALREQHPFWLPLVPERWPQRGDLLARHPVPVFFTNPNGQSVAIINAVGLSKLATRLGIDLAVLPALPDSIGIVLDADDVGTPQDRHAELLKAITARPEPEAAQLQLPKNPGIISDGSPRFGVFVMPDNESSGTLEDLLLEAGGQAYPELQKAATDYVQGIDGVNDFTTEDLAEFRKPAGRKKATIAAMASILKPGKAIQVSIQDNRWLDAAAIQLPRIKEANRFIQELLN
jgi:hypothetical protein